MATNIGYLEYVPLDQLTKPRSNMVVLVDYWWAVHPERGAAFFRRSQRGNASPQCNQHEAITTTLIERLYPNEGIEARQIPCAFIPQVLD